MYVSREKYIFVLLLLLAGIARVKCIVKSYPLCCMLWTGTPQDHEFDLVKNGLGKLSGVQSVHDLHMWALTLNHTLLSAHLTVGKYFINQIWLKKK